MVVRNQKSVKLVEKENPNEDSLKEKELSLQVTVFDTSISVRQWAFISCLTNRILDKVSWKQMEKRDSSLHCVDWQIEARDR